MEQPLDPFRATGEFSAQFPPLFGLSAPDIGALNISAFAPVLLLLAFLAWVIYSLAVTYHWFRYAHTSWVTVPALATHVVVSGTLVLYSLSGLL